MRISNTATMQNVIFKEDKNAPVFSIITVCLNNLEGLKRTLASLRNQTMVNYEWIVVDGNSTDCTQEYLESLNLENMSWLSEQDDGLYDAMNKGMAMAKGEYLVFLNSGDVLADHEVLARVKDVVRKRDFPDFIYGDTFEHFNNDENVLKKARSHKWLWYGMFTHHQAMFYKRSSIGDLRYRLEYKLAADYAFTTEFLKQSRNIFCAQFPICIFEGGGLTSSGSAHLLGMKEQWHIGRRLQDKSTLFCFVTLCLHLLKHLSLLVSPGAVRLLRYNT